MKDLPKKKLLRPDEVAAFFQVTKKTVYSWIKSGHLEAVKPGRAIRIPREAVEKCIS